MYVLFVLYLQVRMFGVCVYLCLSSVLVDPFRYRLIFGFLIAPCSVSSSSYSQPGLPNLFLVSSLVKQRWPLVNMMMTVQMPVMLLLLMVAMRHGPVSLFRSMLAASTGATAVGTVRSTAASAVMMLLLRMRMLMLLQVQKMLLLMMRMRQATSSSHAELLLLLLVIATGQILLTVDASGHQDNRSIGTLLQAPVLLGVRVTFAVTQILKHVAVQCRELVPYSLAFGLDDLAVAQQPFLAHLHVLDFVGQRHNLVQFAFAAVLGGHLVLAPPPDVPDQRQLRLAQVVLGQALVELVHRQIDDVLHGNGDLERTGTFLVPSQVLLLSFPDAFVSGLGLWIGTAIVRQGVRMVMVDHVVMMASGGWCRGRILPGEIQ